MAFGSKNRVRVQAGVEGVGQSVSELGRFRSAFDNLANSKGAQTVLQGVGMGAGIGGWNALSAGISKVVDFTFDSINAASNLREAMSLNAQVFEVNTDAVAKWASTSTDAFSKREALTFAAEFGTAFKNVGLTLDDTTTKAETLTTLAGDLGSAFNRSSEEAATALRSGLLGESEPLRAFGVFLDEAKVKAQALAMGMRPVNGVFTDAQKVTARYQLILEQTGDSQGMFGRDSSSLADAQKRLQSNVEDLQAAIAEKLTPTMAGASDAAATFVSRLTYDLPIDKTYESTDAWGMLGDAIDDTIDAFTAWDGYTSAAWDRQVRSTEYAKQVLIDFRASERESWKSAGETSAAVGTAFDKIRQEAADMNKEIADAAQRADDLRAAWKKLAGQTIDGALAQEQLSLKIQGTTLELAANRRQLAELEAIRHPTASQQADMVDLRLRISEGRGELANLRADLISSNGLTMDELKEQIANMGAAAHLSAAQMNELYRAALGVQSLGYAGNNANPRGGGNVARAGGGPVMAGQTYDVGEVEREKLVMFPGGGGMVIPTGEGRGAGGSSVVVHTHINLDGRQVAEVVDRHLYYKQARAPQSPYAG